MVMFVFGLIFILGGIAFGGITMKGWKFNYKQVISVGVGIAFVILAGVRTVPTGHTGIVTTFGHVEDYTLEAGIHFISPWCSVINMDNRTQKETLELQCFSSDIQEVNIKYTINYQIDKTNAQKIYRDIGVNYYNVVIMPKIQELVKTFTAKYTAENLVASRIELAAKIQKELTSSMGEENIQLVETAIENMTFTEAFTNAVEEKQVAQQNKLKAQTQKEQAIIESEAKAQTKLIEAEAEAKANSLLEKSLSAKILQQRFLDKWNGELPKVTSGDSAILDVSSLLQSSESK